MLEGRLSPALEGHSCGKRLAAALLSVPLLVALAVTTVARALAVRDEQGEQLAVLARGRVRHERRSRLRRGAVVRLDVQDPPVAAEDVIGRDDAGGLPGTRQAACAVLRHRARRSARR